MMETAALQPPALGAAKDGEESNFVSIIIIIIYWPCVSCFFFFFFFFFLCRGQPITTSSGKWLQLLLTISDVVDLSRFRFDLTYRVVRSDSTLFSLPFSTSQSSPTPGYGGNNGAIGAIGIGVAQHISGMGNVDMSSGGIAVDSNIIVSYGDPVPGTLCSHNLHSCDQRTCIIQSPNFPGLYPR